MRKSTAAIACALAATLAVSAPAAQAKPNQCLKKAHQKYHGKELKQAVAKCRG